MSGKKTDSGFSGGKGRVQTSSVCRQVGCFVSATWHCTCGVHVCHDHRRSEEHTPDLHETSE